MNTQEDHHVRTHNKHLQRGCILSGPAKKGWLIAACFLLLLGNPGRASADTYVGGIISGTWTKANSPYILTNNVQTLTLTIQPGVTVSASNYTFEVNDVLTAIGTEAEPIVFNARHPAVGWQGILLNNANILGSTPSCDMRWCIISNALNSGVRIINTVPYFEHCVFANNSNSSGNGGGVYASMNQGSLAFHYCTLANNTSRYSGGGIYASLSTNTLVLEGCEVSGNVVNPSILIYENYGGGVCVYGGLEMTNCLVATNSLYGRTHGGGIRASYGGGLYVTGPAQVNNCIFRGNYVRQANSGGITAGARGGGVCGSTTFSIANSVFSDNRCSGDTSSLGAGLYIPSGAGSPSVVNCTFAYNNAEGLYSIIPNAVVMNCILYSNYSGGTQIIGPTNVSYCNVQNGYAGTGNTNVQPFFENLTCFKLAPGSRCIDAGNPGSAFNDVCLAPCGSSQGAVRNDIGAYGGPGACGMLDGCGGPWGCPPSIDIQPSDQTSCLGHSATFTVSASGTGPLSYQWYFNTNTPLDNATNATLTLANLQATNAGKYSVVVSNLFGSTNSSFANLTVLDAYSFLETHCYFGSYMYAGVNVAGQPGASYVLKCTSDLRNNWATWTPLATNTVDSSGWWFHLDTQSPYFPQRFYGARLAP